jgi:DNA polymerase elongation subunit (family B)
MSPVGNQPKPRILFLDVETLPNRSYTWGKYDQNVVAFEQESCLATFAAKWLGEPVFAKALPDYKGYKAGSYDDSKLVNDLWNLMNEADIIVAHNGNSFDIKVIQGRFIFHKLTPPAPFKTVDTLTVARKIARFNSNKLDDLGELLGEGRKIKTDFDLWLGCINGDPNSWARMARYNKQDVVLLEHIYKRFLPWITNHPNVGIGLDGERCPRCGGTNLQSRGYAVALTRRYKRFQCQDCGSWGRSVKCVDSVCNTNCA